MVLVRGTASPGNSENSFAKTLALATASDDVGALKVIWSISSVDATPEYWPVSFWAVVFET